MPDARGCQQAIALSRVAGLLGPAVPICCLQNASVESRPSALGGARPRRHVVLPAGTFARLLWRKNDVFITDFRWQLGEGCR